MEVLERYAGETGPCAVCAKTITIPARTETTPKNDGSPGGSPSPLQAKQQSSAESTGVALATLVGLLGGAVVCFSVIFLVVVLVVRVALPAAQQMRVARMHQSSQDNIRRIMVALNKYHDNHGSFPPAYFTDDKGKPMHSWRVMILPELGRNDLYQQYNFDVPWNDTRNVTVTMQMPSEYNSFGADQALGVSTTQICAVVGKETMFPYAKSVSRDQITDPYDTLLSIVEVQGMGFDWTDPTQDYDIDSPQGTFLINDNVQGSKLLTSSTLTGNIGTLNEDTYHVPMNTSSVTLRDMATRSGGEFVPVRDLLPMTP